MVIAGITSRPDVGVVGREDAKQVLMLGQEEEVAGFPKRVLHERSQDIISSRRSGYPERPVSSAAGVIEVAVTQVSDTVEIFRSRLREAWRHHSNLLKKTIHPLCLARPRYACAELIPFIACNSLKFPTECEISADILGVYFILYCFTEHHWKHVRTSNTIKRFSREVKGKAVDFNHLSNETLLPMIVFNLLQEEGMKWQKVEMKIEDITWIEEALKHWRKKQSDWNAWRNFGLSKMYRPLKEEVRYAKKKFPLVMECNQRF